MERDLYWEHITIERQVNGYLPSLATAMTLPSNHGAMQAKGSGAARVYCNSLYDGHSGREEQSEAKEQGIERDRPIAK